MNYVLYPLQFDTPIHFGCAENGGKLEQSSLTYRSDSLFGALCCELAACGNIAGLQRLHDGAANGSLIFSDLFPYVSEEESGLHLYVPKPILQIEHTGQTFSHEYMAFRKEATQQKKQKKLSYIRVSQMDKFLKAIKDGIPFTGDDCAISHGQLIVRVNCSADIPKPYYVHQIQFTKSAGLYGVIGYKNEEDRDWLLELLEILGLSGIGGKRSSGYGKFHFREDPIDMDEMGLYKDDAILYQMMTCSKASLYMCLSSLLPTPEDVTCVKEGQYTLCRRSGFLMPDGDVMQKKNDVYMIGAGSCFPKKIKGMLADVSGYVSHPVWRYGTCLYAGLIV